MLDWLLIAVAIAVLFALTLQQWKQSRRRPPRKPAQPRLPVVLAHGFLGFDEKPCASTKIGRAHV